MINTIHKLAKQALRKNRTRALRAARWYDDAGAWCSLLDADFELAPGTAAGYVAALSPLNSWDVQLSHTPPSIAACVQLLKSGRRAHEGIRGPGFFANRDKAARILSGEAPLDVLGGDKVRSFYRNLTGDFSTVTIDRHAVAIAGYSGKGLSAAGVPTSKLYARISFAFRMAGERLEMTGPEIQALTWCYWREIKNGRKW